MAVDTDEQSSTETDQPPDQVADWLDTVLPTWVDEGLISPEQAETIRRRHGLDEPRDSTQSRLVTAVSVLGAALVGAGLLVFLGTNWASIPRFVRTLLLIGVPPTAFGLGYQFTTNRDSPRVGHALWVLGVVLTGPSLGLLDELYGLSIEATWLLAVWFVVALVAGESFDSRPAVGLSFILAAALVVDLIEPGEPAMPIAGLGLTLVGLSGLRTAGQSSAATTDPSSEGQSVDQLAASYRIAGVSILTIGLLWLSTQTHRWYATDLGPVTGVITLGAVVAIALLGVQSRSQPARRPLAVWTVAAGGCVVLSTAIATAVPELLTDLTGFLLIHGLLFGLLIGVVMIGYLSATATLITVAIGLVFLQLVVFLTSTVADALPTSLALVVTGSILLVVAIGLERGRRSLLDRL